MNEERSKIIIEYIKNHPGCKSEEIAQGVESLISRTLVFRFLEYLKGNNIIINKSPNRRDNRYYLNEDNYFLKILNHLTNFETNYFDLLEKVLKEIITKPVSLEKYKKQQRESKYFYSSSSYEGLFAGIISLFFLNIQRFLFKLAIEIPNISTDKHNIEKLSSDILSKVFHMYSRLFQELDSKEVIKYLAVNPDKIKTNADLLNSYFKDTIFPIDDMLGYEDHFKFFKLEKEFLKLI